MNMLCLLLCAIFFFSIESIRAAVPSPYTPVKASATEIKCLGRTIRLGQMLLPQQITSAGEKLLDKPIAILANPVAALGGISGAGKVISNDGNSAELEWVGNSNAFEIKVHMTFDCDGFCWYSITLTPKQPVELTSLLLSIPLRSEAARYIHTANFTWGQGISQGLAELGYNWHGSFMPYVWIGGEERGLAWCCESDEGWNLKETTSALRVERLKSAVIFTSVMLDHAESVSSPINIRFGLQATPVKLVSFAWRAGVRIFHNVNYDWVLPGKDNRIPLDILQRAGVKTVVYHDMWPTYYGQLVPSSPELFRNLIDECHKRGIRLLVYVGYGLARNAPEMQGHHEEWSVLPLIPWIPSYKPEFRTFDACCPRSGWADWLVTGIDKLFSEYDLDGIYFDGTSEAFRCQNEKHGCGWRDRDGNLHAGYAILAARNLMRRIADVVHKHNPSAILDVHMSDNLTIPTLSFCDSYWDGEQFEVYKAADKVEIPLDQFRTEFMGYAHGLDAQFLCYENRPFTFDEAIAIAWLHGVEVRPINKNQLRKVVPIWAALDRFGTPLSNWLPYWKGSGVSCSDPSVKASVFTKDGKALIFVSHLERESLSTTLVLDPKVLRIPSVKLTATDAITGKPLEMRGVEIPLEFEGMNWRLIEVR
ncbi:MAG: DUF6067 family protein, partial [Armatimonadota bacterium]|nr:DUF6067 family protein [Armatimonadota bacterium]